MYDNNVIYRFPSLGPHFATVDYSSSPKTILFCYFFEHSIVNKTTMDTCKIIMENLTTEMMLNPTEDV